MIWIACILFILDLLVYQLLHKPLLQSVLCFYSMRIINYSADFNLLVTLLFITLEAFIITGNFGTPLVYLIPLSAIALYTASFIKQENSFLCYLFLIISLLLHGIIVEQIWPGNPQANLYTIYKIFANLIVESVFLKYFLKVD